MATHPASSSIHYQQAMPIAKAPATEVSCTQELSKPLCGTGTADDAIVNAKFASEGRAGAALIEAELDHFERLMNRIRGTVTIHGDIVNPDPEMWGCGPWNSDSGN